MFLYSTEVNISNIHDICKTKDALFTFKLYESLNNPPRKAYNVIEKKMYIHKNPVPICY